MCTLTLMRLEVAVDLSGVGSFAESAFGPAFAAGLSGDGRFAESAFGPALLGFPISL